MYRSVDPCTSKDAADGVDVAQLQVQLLLGMRSVAKQVGDATALEAAHAARRAHQDSSIESLRKRYLDLIRRGAIRRHNRRRCLITGRTATTFVVVR